MNNPEGGVEQCEVLHQNVLTEIEIDELWTQTVFLCEDTLIHRYTILGILQQSGTRSASLANHTLLETKTRIAVPRPPGVVGTATVNSSFAGYGNVGLLICIDARTEVTAVDALPACGNDGVEVWLEGKLQYSILLYHQIDMTQQRDGSCDEGARRNDDTSTAFL